MKKYLIEYGVEGYDLETEIIDANNEWDAMDYASEKAQDMCNDLHYSKVIPQEEWEDYGYDKEEELL